MGTAAEAPRAKVSAGLAGALFTAVQQRVLGLLFGQPERRFQSAELIRLSQSGTGAVHRLVTRLAQAGLVTVTHSGAQKYYQANMDNPVFAELHGLIVKTSGLAEPVREALQPLAAQIERAFIYGSIAKGEDRAESDVDLMVISDTLSYTDLYESLAQAEATIARPINPNLMTSKDWREKLSMPDSFVAKIATQPRLYLIGSEDAQK